VTPALRLRRLADRVLEAPDLPGLTRLLTQELPAAAGVSSASLLLWDRKLDVFEELPRREARTEPRARYLLSEGRLLETQGEDDGVLVPLMARSGLVGMLVLGPRPRRRAPFRPGEVRQLSALASRSALALENHLYQRELVASERMAALGTMAGMLAHDFRGPMTVIRGYAETLLDERPLPPREIQERARLIVRMVDRLERMTNETLDFSRESHQLVRRRVNLAAMLGDLADSVPLELPGLVIVRDFRVPADTEASVDVDKIRRAITNIAANARDAMGGGGRLHLLASTHEGMLELVVADEGPGVPEAIRERLFEPFVTHGKKGGTGLGLAVCQRFVQDHGGRLELLPEGPGARFRLILPLTPPV
jgi:signal transduction histidine kinase